MRVTLKDVEKIARLAKLSVSDEEKEKFQIQLDAILDYVDQLNQADTENVEPTFYIQHDSSSMREDQVAESLPREAVLRNAPAHSLGFFRVPKILSQAKKKG